MEHSHGAVVDDIYAIATPPLDPNPHETPPYFSVSLGPQMTDKKWLRSMRHSSFAVDDHIPIAGRDQPGPPTGSPDFPVNLAGWNLGPFGCRRIHWRQKRRKYMWCGWPQF